MISSKVIEFQIVMKISPVQLKVIQNKLSQKSILNSEIVCRKLWYLKYGILLKRNLISSREIYFNNLNI
jgi:hypothetical protein